MDTFTMSAPLHSTSSSPLGAFFSTLLQDHNCTSFADLVNDNSRPTLQDRQTLKINLPTKTAILSGSNHSSLHSSSSHSTARWESNEAPTVVHPASTSSAATRETSLIPVMRKPSPIANSSSFTFPTYGIPTCPTRKLSQDTAAPTKAPGSSTQYPMRKDTVSPESDFLSNLECDEASALSHFLKLPLYNLSNNSKEERVSSSKALSIPSAGCKPPLSPKKRAKLPQSCNADPEQPSTIYKFQPRSKINSVIMGKGKAAVTRKCSLVKPGLRSPIKAKAGAVKFAHASIGLKSKLKTQPEESSISPTLLTLSPSTASSSSTGSSPRSITDYAVASSFPPTSRRTLSKTLGVDFREPAPVQPTRRPSTDPEALVFRPSLLGPALLRRQISAESSCDSSSSSIYTSGSQASSNSDTICTFPSLCSSLASEITVKAKNGTNEGIFTPHQAHNAACTNGSCLFTKATTNPMPNAARSLSFLPTRLEQVSEHSISEHSVSTTSSFAGPISPYGNEKDRRNVSSPIPAQLHTSGETETKSDLSPTQCISGMTKPSHDIQFKPTSSRTEEISTVLTLLEDSTATAKTKTSSLSGRFSRMWRKFR